MDLPRDLLDAICMRTGEERVARALEGHVSDDVVESLTEKKILVYGKIQSGKTREIIDVLRRPLHDYVLRVLVVQNSTLVLRQYAQRLRSAGISFQVVSKGTRSIVSNTLVLLNNKKRYDHFERVVPSDRKYLLILDEADQTIKRCPLMDGAFKTYYVTATPFRFKGFRFDKVVKVAPRSNYVGIEDVAVHQYTDERQVMEEFHRERRGMLLDSRFHYFADMDAAATRYSNEHRRTPVVLLATEKHMLLNGRRSVIGNWSVSEIIDKLSRYDHVVFVAGRLSGRGLSYVSSDYSRHLTYQIARVQQDATGFVQKLRLLGVYRGAPELKLFVDDEKRFERHFKFVAEYDVERLRAS